MEYNQMVTGFLELEKTINDTVLLCGTMAHEGNVFATDLIAKLKNKTFIEQGIQRLEQNLFTVIEDLTKGVEDFKNASFFNAGMDFGKVLEMFLEGPTSNLVNLIYEELSSLGSINWPFINCGSSDPLVASTLTLDQQPTKGTTRSINMIGTSGAHMENAKVKIETLLNGNLLNTQFDDFSKVFEANDPVNYSFQTAIPSFAPSGSYSIKFTFQNTGGNENGCVNFQFTL